MYQCIYIYIDTCVNVCIYIIRWLYYTIYIYRYIPLYICIHICKQIYIYIICLNVCIHHTITYTDLKHKIKPSDFLLLIRCALHVLRHGIAGSSCSARVSEWLGGYPKSWMVYFMGNSWEIHGKFHEILLKWMISWKIPENPTKYGRSLGDR